MFVHKYMQRLYHKPGARVHVTFRKHSSVFINVYEPGSGWWICASTVDAIQESNLDRRQVRMHMSVMLVWKENQRKVIETVHRRNDGESARYPAQCEQTTICIGM